MPTALAVRLSAARVEELTRLRDHHPKPYVRERAAAVLKVADGQSVRQVALGGLLRPRDPETVADWVHGYLRRGAAALHVAKGRGRKPAFSP